MSEAWNQTYFSDATRAWQEILRRIISRGAYVEPRGKTTREILSNQIGFDMRRPLPLHPQRKASRKFTSGEAWWILSGRSDVASIEKYNKRIRDFSDDGRTFFGAYGPPIEQQFNHVTSSLIKDPETRQAVITIWRPRPPATRDVPCTVYLNFLIRSTPGGRRYLHAFARMRSSDAWLGVPYDFFNFSMVALDVLLHLRYWRPEKFGDVDLGMLHWSADSSHLYFDDLENAAAIAAAPAAAYPRLPIDVDAFCQVDEDPHEALLELLHESAEEGVWPAWPVVRSNKEASK